jgi:predicted nucleic acid-binding protein
MTSRTFLDTNILVYAFDAGEAAKQARSRELLTTGDPDEFVISAQVLNEFYVATTRKLATPLAPHTAEQAVRSLSRFDVVAMDARLTIRGITRARESDLSLWDALVVEAARHAKCERVLTEDLNSGQDFDGVSVVNPFE